MPKRKPAKAFLAKVGNGLLRIVALGVFLLAHLGLWKLVGYVFPGPMSAARLWIEALSFCVFAFVYVYLLWDLVKIFVPWVERRTW